MQRYFVSPEQMTEHRIQILGEDARHLIRVLRAKSGERVIVSDGAGRDWIAEIESLEDGCVTAVPLERLEASGEPSAEVWIAQSLPKGDKFETVVQKCTELGASRIIPFTSARTVVRYEEKKQVKKLERWQKIAKEAAEQSHRSAMPIVEPLLSWNELLRCASSVNALLCYELENKQGLKTVLQELRSREDAANQPWLIIVGPEGGLTEAEAAEAQSAGCISVSLGRRILRTETAAMAALACVMYELDEMT